MKKNFHDGFGLIELLVALGVLATALASLYGAVQLADRTLRKAAEKTQVAFLLEENAEALRHIRDKGWDTRIKNLPLNQLMCLDFGTNDYGLIDFLATILNLHFDETPNATTFIDSSYMAKNGNCSGATCPQSGTPSTNQFGNVARFDGIDDSVTVLYPNLTAYTIEAWVKPGDIPPINSGRNIIVRGDASGSANQFANMLLMWNSSTGNGSFRHWTRDAGFQIVQGTTQYEIGKWYHVVGTAQNGGQMRLYVNGIEEGTPDNIGTLWTGGDRYFIGSNAFGNSYFFGDIDNIAIFNRVLSANEIEERYAAGPPCRLIDNLYVRFAYFGNACRNDSTKNIGGFSYAQSGTCGTGHTVDPDTKIATTTVFWSSFSESAAMYLANLKRN